jgi:hypothetical protein
MVMCALTDRLDACMTMNQAYSWSETIDASYRGKGELPARPRVTPLPGSRRHYEAAYADSFVESIQASYIKMTALSRRSKRFYINRLFEFVVGRCQRESALKPRILMAAFVTSLVKGHVSIWGTNKSWLCVL